MALGSSMGGAAGTAFGGPIGGILGSLGGSLLSGLLGSKAGHRGRMERFDLFNPQQQNAQNQSLQMGLQGLQNPYEGFDPIQQNAMSQFQNQIVPSIAERFTSMGGQRSSGFQSALQQGASGLASNLAGMRSQYGLQNRGLSQQLLGLGMQPSFQYGYRPAESGFLGGALGGLSQGLGSLGIQGLGQGLGYFGQGGFGGGMGGGNQLQQLMALLSQFKGGGY